MRPRRIARVEALTVSLSLLAALATGCSSGEAGPASEKAHGAARISAALVGVGQSQIDHVALTITCGAGRPAAVLAMSKTDATHWSVYVSDLPAGSGCTFAVDAYTADDTRLYTGSADVVVSAGSTAQVAIMAQEVNPPQGPVTHMPVIDALTSSDVAVTPGAQVNLAVSAHDPDGNAMSYAWATSCGGSFSAAEAAATAWTAPAGQQANRCQLSIAISGGQTSVTAYLVIEVQVQTSGEAQVSVLLDACPIVTVVGNEYIVRQGQTPAAGMPGDLSVGLTADIEVTASDPDGDALIYAYSSSCESATFEPAGSAGPVAGSGATPNLTRFHVDDPAAQCSISVVVSDGRGGTTTAIAHLSGL